MTSKIHIDTVRGRLRWFQWRGLILLLVFMLGLTAFCGGADVSERDIGSADFMTRVYYTLGLFVLGGLDLGVPTGGPVWARATLWLVYFAAPAITTSALVEGILRAIRPDRFRLRRLRQHVEEKIGGEGEEPVFLRGSGDDSINIRTALRLSRKYSDTKILARCFRHSTFAEQISSECDFEFVSTAELLLSGMHPEWFGGNTLD